MRRLVRFLCLLTIGSFRGSHCSVDCVGGTTYQAGVARDAVLADWWDTRTDKASSAGTGLAVNGPNTHRDFPAAANFDTTEQSCDSHTGTPCA